MQLKRTSRVAGTLMVALTIASATAVGVALARPTDLPVIGFQESWQPIRAITRHADEISDVSVDGLNITGAGRVAAVGKANLRQLHAAHAQGLTADLLVQNWSSKIDDFSEALAHATLGTRSAVDELASALSTDITRGGWNGITLDLESLKRRDRSGLSALVRRLHHELPSSDTIAITVQLSTSLSGYRALGYDLPTLVKLGAKIILMAYDQHGPWEKQPGPIGALTWQKSGIKAIRGAVPADQLILGVAGYGYAWGPNHTITVGDARAERIVKRSSARRQWDNTAGEWHVTLKDGTVMWWSDGRSFTLRARLAKRDHLAGLAVWNLYSSGKLRQ